MEQDKPKARGRPGMGKKIELTLADGMAEQIDKLAPNRSAWIREACEMRLERIKRGKQDAIEDKLYPIEGIE